MKLVKLLRAVHEEGMFRLDENPKSGGAMSVNSVSMVVWHKCLGHLNPKAMKQMMSGLVSGINFKENYYPSCIDCAKGKQHRLPFPTKGHRSMEVLELIHSDLCSPFEERSIGGCRFFLTFVDDFTRKVFIYFLERKS